jgi:ubiquitin carboxyl-terminal hydrolase L3
MGKAWVPLESNPEVLTDYITKIGLPNPSYIFHDVFGLDEVHLDHFKLWFIMY